MTEAEIQHRLAPLVAAASKSDVDYTAMRRVASVEKPTYVQQLTKIEVDFLDVIDAVKNFKLSRVSRQDWYDNGYINESDVIEYDKHLKESHKLAFEHPRIAGVSDAEHGKETYRQCRWNCCNTHLSDRQPYAGYASGALHELADSRQIGWHPNWEQWTQPPFPAILLFGGISLRPAIAK